MELGKIILNGGKRIFRLLAEQLVAPTETKDKKQVEVEAQRFEIAKSVNQSKKDNIEWKIEQYEKLGLSKADIRSRILPEIEKCEDPISILKRLKEKKVILDIHEQENDGETDPHSPSDVE